MSVNDGRITRICDRRGVEGADIAELRRTADEFERQQASLMVATAALARQF